MSASSSSVVFWKDGEKKKNTGEKRPCGDNVSDNRRNAYEHDGHLQEPLQRIKEIL